MSSHAANDTGPPPGHAWRDTDGGPHACARIGLVTLRPHPVWGLVLLLMLVVVTVLAR